MYDKVVFKRSFQEGMILEGGCHKCGRTMQAFYPNSFPTNDISLTCNSCYEKYYSPEAIREKKLKQVLKKSIWRRIKNFITND